MRFLLVAIILTLAFATANAEDALNLKGPFYPANKIDNEAHIDTPEELDTATEKPHDLSSDDLARELNNPNTPLAKLTVEYTTVKSKGDLPDSSDQWVNVVAFKPVFPFPLNEEGTRNLFIRPVLGYVVEQPVFNVGKNQFSDRSGFTDLGFDVALGNSYDNGMILVGGLQGTLPTGSDSLSGDQYRLGPEAVIAHINKSRVIAAFPSHQWDISGDGPGYSKSRLELFAFKFIPGGWTVGTNPKMDYDWKNDQGTIPINLVVKKLVKVGDIPMQLSTGVNYFIEQDDDFGQDWGLEFSVTPVVPNFVYQWFK